MGIGLGLELGSGVRVGVVARTCVESALAFYFAAVNCTISHSFTQYAFHIAQMQNGYGKD